MCCKDGNERLSYNSYPAGHIFRIGIAILVLTGNCIVMRVAATVALLSIRESQEFCKTNESACGVTAFSVLGSVLPILCAILTGSFAIVAAKRGLKWSFIATFVVGCLLCTISFLLNLLFNGLRHGFNIVPALVPDIIEIILFCVISVLAMVTGILCIKSLVKDRSEQYIASPGEAGTSAVTTEHHLDDGYAYYDNEAVDETQFPEENSGPTSRDQQSSPQRHRSNLRLSSRSDSRVQSELAVVVENDVGKVTNFDIFTIDSARNSSGR
ncbi:hypothetical protein BOX15_Mlig024423g2 [Macrostomum lignano]|uniref:Uncharacterized protein n=1 Tax=Macrostomum lignano TaxID=282301 RepID=A0A267FW71_9PLAT|nr:hypothetical protein BOX15_Mlig024423g1 [Macrostomum lignano]PAA66518.1 hypothetical protein BOX15_Mlig003483g1 [Macrostomum lignano]PAA77259.1 hypothetical protein BOX15_Mlig024423g2 [Macrostomum lignano]